MTERVIVRDSGAPIVRSSTVVNTVRSGGGGGSGGGNSTGIHFSQGDVVLGRQTAGAGYGEEIPCNAFGRSVIAATVVAGSLLFAASANAIGTDNANLFWDSTNKRLGIGTNGSIEVGGSDAVLKRYAAKQISITGDGTGATTNAGWILGYYGSGSLSGLWASAVAPTAANYVLACDGSTTNLQGSTIAFNNGSVTRWSIHADGHFLAGTDNTYDIGASGATRPRNVYVAGAGIFGGYISSATQIAGTTDAAVFTLGGANDVVLARDAAGVLAQRNGTSAQRFHVYNTYTASDNFERLNIAWSGNNCYVQTAAGVGGGSTRHLIIDAANTLYLAGGNAATGHWLIQSTGGFLPATDDSLNVGGASNRAQNVYASRSIVLQGPTGFVNGLTLSSAATTASPTIAATGSDANVGITLTPKGTGVVNVNGVLKIGNTANAVSPTAPNRTITIDVGGTTLYLHAKTTND